MTNATSPTLDGLLLQVLITPEGQADPYPCYAQMRSEARVSRTAFGPYVVNGYQECLGVLRDPRLGRGMGIEDGSTGIFSDAGTRRGEFMDASQHNMLMADPPDHTRLRRLVSRSFTPRQVDRLRPAIEQLVADLLDDLAERGEVDFMAEFALPLPMDVIGELVGVPASERAALQPHVRAAAKGIEPVLSEEEVEASIEAIVYLAEYFVGLLDERRRQPRDDLLSALVQARESDDRLTDDEITSTAILLFSAGFETTTNLLGNGLLALLRHPAQLDDWRHHPEIAPTAVEELLRFDSPVQFNLRTALEPADLLGEPLERGDRIVVLQGAGNRDPARFDRPDDLDLRRVDNTPLSFGWGIHHCIGAPLARMEGEIAFNALLARFPTMELTSDEVHWRPSFTLRGLLDLPLQVATA
ncbi:MAG TPA: cytochrome P450 [Acidimicrobiales bacterium]|jgi:cytochrome P450|nr:cytochrome P450 [Acidimicrobiales bacterium]